MVLWLDSLNMVSLICLLLSPISLWRCTDLRYLHSTVRAERILRFLLRLRMLKLNHLRVAWSQGELFDESGCNSWFQIEERIKLAVDDAGNRLDRMLGPLGMEPFVRLPRAWVIDGLKHSLYGAFRDQISSFWVARVLLRNSGSLDGEAEHALWVRGGPFSASIGMISDQDGPVRTKLYGAFIFGGFLPLLRLLKELSKMAIRSLIAFARLAGQSLATNRSKTQPMPADPCVALAYNWKSDTRGRNDLYWWDGEWLPPHRILFYFNRPNAALTRELAEEFDRRGFRRIVQDPSGCLIQGEPVWRSSPRSVVVRALWTSKILMHACRWKGAETFGEWAWALYSVVSMTYRVSYWEDFFSTNRVVAHTNHGGVTSGSHIDQTLALHLSNGCNFRTTYSYHSVLCCWEVGGFHVFFAWGRCCGSSERMIPYLSRSANVIISGHPFDHYFRSLSNSQCASQQFNHLKFIVAAFDEGYAEEALEINFDLWQSFYKNLVVWALRRRDVLVLFKPKDAGTTRERLVELVPEADDAIQSGYVAVLSREVNPFEVAADADIAVGLGVYTAAIEAALYGIPALHYDPPNRPCEQLMDRVPRQLIHHDMVSLLEQVDRFIDSRDPPDLGSHREVLDELDPFRDGKADQRIGEYLRWYFEGVSDGLQRDEALDQANELYRAKWGADKVIVNPILSRPD